MAKNNRFITKYTQGNGFSGWYKILVDRETGVNYVFSSQGYAGGMTVLLDAQGNPVVTPVGKYDEE